MNIMAVFHEHKLAYHNYTVHWKDDNFVCFCFPSASMCTILSVILPGYGVALLTVSTANIRSVWSAHSLETTRFKVSMPLLASVL